MRVRGRLDNGKGNTRCVAFPRKLRSSHACRREPRVLAASSRPTEALAEQQHQSFLRVGETGNGTARQITLGLNKSMIIELPREVREVVVSNPDKWKRCCKPRRALI